MSLGLVDGLEDRAPRLGAAAYGWRRRGLPLLTSKTWAFQPLAALATAEKYLPDGSLRGAAASGYLVGSANAMLVKRLSDADLVVDVDTGSLTFGASPAAAAAGRFDAAAEALASTTGEALASGDAAIVGFDRSPDGVRAACRAWLLGALRGAAPPSGGFFGKFFAASFSEILAGSPAYAGRGRGKGTSPRALRSSYAPRKASALGKGERLTRPRMSWNGDFERRASPSFRRPTGTRNGRRERRRRRRARRRRRLRTAPGSGTRASTMLGAGGPAPGASRRTRTSTSASGPRTPRTATGP